MARNPPGGESWEVQGGGQQEEGKDPTCLVDPKGSADFHARPISGTGPELRKNLPEITHSCMGMGMSLGLAMGG